MWIDELQVLQSLRQHKVYFPRCPLSLQKHNYSMSLISYAHLLNTKKTKALKTNKCLFFKIEKSVERFRNTNRHLTRLTLVGGLKKHDLLEVDSCYIFLTGGLFETFLFTRENDALTSC